VPLVFFVVSCILTLGAGTAAFVWFWGNERGEVDGVLQAVALAEARIVESWVVERRSQSAQFAEREGVRRIVAAGRGAGGAALSDADRALLMGAARLAQLVPGFARLALFDAAGDSVWKSSSDLGDSDDGRDGALRTVASGAPQLVQVHAGRTGGAVDALVGFTHPVVASPGDGGRPIGAICMCFRAGAALFPLLQAWESSVPPVRSLILRSLGDRVQMFGPGLDVSEGEVTLTKPKSWRDLLAVRALEVPPRLFEGLNERGLPGFGRAIPVAHTDWVVLALADRAAAHEPFRLLAIAAALIAGLLVGATGWILRSTWWEGRRRVVAERKDARAEISRVLSRAALAIEAAQDAYVLGDAEGRILEVSRATIELTGYSRDELRQMTFAQLAEPDAPAEHRDRLESVRVTRPTRLSSRWRRKDATVTDVEVSLTSLGEPDFLFAAFVRDVTELRRAHALVAEQVAQLERQMLGSVAAVGAIIELRDPYTAGHQRRVATLARAIARELGYADDRCTGMEILGFVHDIGKVAVPAEFLSKPCMLTEIEFDFIKTHAAAGREILASVAFPWPVAEAIHQHHERLDGSGYPRGLAGDAILPEARIIAVADTVEAMVSHRPYRPQRSLDEALAELQRGAGRLYDSKVVAVTVRLFRERGFSW